MRRKIILQLALIIVGVELLAQPAERVYSREEYIQIYKDDAIREMLINGVPASITLSQGILESDNGNSPLAKYANNHFGIKCHVGWDGPRFYQDDDAANECFRKYYSVYRSYKDHSEFLRTRKRYESLFSLKTTDYKGWARGLKKAGYATNPKYADLLIKIIEDNNLQQYDRVRKMPAIKKEDEVRPVQKIKASERKVTEIKIHENNIKYVLAKRGDSYYKIAEENEMGLWQILKYNDRDKHRKPSIGEVVYLQPKRNKAKAEYHIAKGGESMWEISQIYGVKLSKLLKKNNKQSGYNPLPGEKIYLRKKSS